jgi:hypothetical protein
VFLLSGCATSLKQDVHQLESDISQSGRRLEAAKVYLRTNPDVYRNQQCVLLARGPQPSPQCTTREEARNYALALCAISYKGCDLALNAAGNQLNSTSKKFLASQACEAALAEMQGERYTADRAVLGAIDAAATSGSEKGGFGGFLWGIVKASVEITKFATFLECSDQKTKTFYDRYDAWANGPARKKSECEAEVATISREERRLAENRALLKEKKDSLLWKMFGD